MRSGFSVAPFLAFVAVALTGSLVPRAALAAGDMRSMGDVAARVVALTNEERRHAGLPVLEHERDLDLAAFAHSERMLEEHYFAHDDPDGTTPSDRAHEYMPRFIGSGGENIWMESGYAPDRDSDLAEKIVKSWMHSPGHRANIMRREFTHIGVGVAASGREVRATQDFAEVRGMLKQALPASVREYDPVLVVAGGAGRGVAPTAFDLVKPGTQTRVSATFPLGRPTGLRVPPGVYRLRFYFPAGENRFNLFDGPLLRVR